jgi:FkbM family methyltransferase
MAVSPLLSAFWGVRGRSIGDTIRLYAHLAFLAAERAWIEVLPRKYRKLAMIDRWKRIFLWAQSEKVYIRALGGYYSLIFYLQRPGVDFDVDWFQWREGEVGMQIGANRGEYSFMASRVIGPRGLCIAVEPNPVAYLDLLELIVLNKASNVLALPAACGNTEGWVELVLPAEEWGDGIIRVKTQGEDEGKVVAHARLCRVDGIVRGLGLERCDFLIIDVEGYELEVLRGADAVLRQFRPRLYIEIHDTWGEIEGILRAYGYTVRAWKGDRPGRGHVWAMPE